MYRSWIKPFVIFVASSGLLAAAGLYLATENGRRTASKTYEWIWLALESDSARQARCAVATYSQTLAAPGCEEITRRAYETCGAELRRGDQASVGCLDLRLRWAREGFFPREREAGDNPVETFIKELADEQAAEVRQLRLREEQNRMRAELQRLQAERETAERRAALEAETRRLEAQNDMLRRNLALEEARRRCRLNADDCGELRRLEQR